MFKKTCTCLRKNSQKSTTIDYFPKKKHPEFREKRSIFKSQNSYEIPS